MLRLVIIKQIAQEATDNAALNSDIAKMLAIQQIDFAIETLLKLIVYEVATSKKPSKKQPYLL